MIFLFQDISLNPNIYFTPFKKITCSCLSYPHPLELHKTQEGTQSFHFHRDFDPPLPTGAEGGPKDLRGLLTADEDFQEDPLYYQLGLCFPLVISLTVLSSSFVINFPSAFTPEIILSWRNSSLLRKVVMATPEFLLFLSSKKVLILCKADGQSLPRIWIFPSFSAFTSKLPGDTQNHGSWRVVFLLKDKAFPTILYQLADISERKTSTKGSKVCFLWEMY